MRGRLGLFTGITVPLLLACPARAQSVDPSVAAADAAYTAKRYADAIPLYQQLVGSRLPDDVRAQAQLRLGYAYYKLENRNQARSEWLDVARLFPYQAVYAAEGSLRGANLAMGSGDYSAALTILRKAVDTYVPLRGTEEFAPELLVRLAETHLHFAEAAKTDAELDGNVLSWKTKIDAEFNQAREAYTRVITEYPGAEDWTAEAAMQMVALEYERALGNGGASLSEVITSAGNFLTTYPGDAVRRPIVLLVRAEAFTELGRVDEALTDLRAIQDVYSASAGQAGGFAEYLTAYCQMRKHYYATAMAGFRQFIDEVKPCFNGPTYRPHALYLIALCQRELGQPDVSSKTLQDVITLYPKTSAAQLAKEAIDRSAGGLPR